MQISLSKKKVLIRIVCAIGLSLGMLINVVSAQMVKTLKIENPEDVLLIKEFGGLMISVNDTVSVQMALPKVIGLRLTNLLIFKSVMLSGWLTVKPLLRSNL